MCIETTPLLAQMTATLTMSWMIVTSIGVMLMNQHQLHTTTTKASSNPSNGLWASLNVTPSNVLETLFNSFVLLVNAGMVFRCTSGRGMSAAGSPPR